MSQTATGSPTAALTRASAPHAYALDPAGNITLFQSPTAANKAATYNNVNELTNLVGQPFAYDASDNLAADGQRNYAWDAENRVVGITYAAQPGKQTTFAYDGFGRRTAITTTVSGSPLTTFYQWCGSRLCRAVNPNGTVARLFRRRRDRHRIGHRALLRPRRPRPPRLGARCRRGQ